MGTSKTTYVTDLSYKTCPFKQECLQRIFHILLNMSVLT